MRGPVRALSSGCCAAIVMTSRLPEERPSPPCPPGGTHSPMLLLSRGPAAARAANFCPPSRPDSPGRFLCNQCAARPPFCCVRIIKPCAHTRPTAVSPWARLRAKFWVPAFARKCLPVTLVPRAHLSWASRDPSICFVWAQQPWLPRWLRAPGGYFLIFPPFSGFHCTMSNTL